MQNHIFSSVYALKKLTASDREDIGWYLSEAFLEPGLMSRVGLVELGELSLVGWVR